MISGKQVAVGAGVLLLGACAALMFQRPPAQTTPAVPDPLATDLVLERRDDSLPLHVQPDTSGAPRSAAAEPARSATKPAAAGPLWGPSSPPPPATQSYPALTQRVPLPASTVSPITTEVGPLVTVPMQVPRTAGQEESLVTRLPSRRQHVVKDGDTLESLAARYLGDEQRGEEIFMANRHLLARPDLLPIGVELVIPAEQSAGALPRPSLPLVPVPWPVRP